MHQVWRRAIHVSMVGFALAVGRLSPWGISLAALAALMFNWWLLPRLSKGRLERHGPGPDLGLLSYPAAVLLLSLIFRNDQIFIVIGWGAMAFGDAAAQWAGLQYGRHRLPWNRNKSWQGKLAFWLVGAPATFLLLGLLPKTVHLGLPWYDWLPIIGITMLITAWAETLPGTINDNLWVPLVAAGTAWLLVYGGPWDVLWWDWYRAAGIPVVLIFMVLSFISRKIDAAGTLTGGLLAALLVMGCGWGGLGSLFLLFVLGTLASGWKRRRKVELGLAQERGGKRSARHAFANAGVAGILGLLAWRFPEQEAMYTLMAIAALASALADTLSSELGSLYGRRFIDLRTGGPGRRGEDGVISVEGTLWGLAGAWLLILAYGVVSNWPDHWPWLMIAAAVGNLLDSGLGASLQRNGLMTNDSVNFGGTLGAALCMGGILYILALTS